MTDDYAGYNAVAAQKKPVQCSRALTGSPA